jgi:hypothetical protein
VRLRYLPEYPPTGVGAFVANSRHVLRYAPVLLSILVCNTALAQGSPVDTPLRPGFSLQLDGVTAPRNELSRLIAVAGADYTLRLLTVAVPAGVIFGVPALFPGATGGGLIAVMAIVGITVGLAAAAIIPALQGVVAAFVADTPELRHRVGPLAAWAYASDALAVIAALATANWMTAAAVYLGLSALGSAGMAAVAGIATRSAMPPPTANAEGSLAREGIATVSAPLVRLAF